MRYCTEVPVLDSFHDRPQDRAHSLFYALSIYRLRCIPLMLAVFQ